MRVGFSRPSFAKVSGAGAGVRWVCGGGGYGFADGVLRDYFIADVVLDGRGPYPMLLDSGAESKARAYISPPRPTGARMRIDGPHAVLSGRLSGSMQIGPIRLAQPIKFPQLFGMGAFLVSTGETLAVVQVFEDSPAETEPRTVELTVLRGGS